MTDYKDAHDYVFIADGSSSDSRSSYVISANLNTKQLNVSNSRNNKNKKHNNNKKRYSISKSSNPRRAQTKIPTPKLLPSPLPPPTHTMVPINNQNEQQQQQQCDEDSIMRMHHHRNTATTDAVAAEVLSAATTTTTTTTTVATMSFELSHAGVGALDGNSIDSNNHNLQQLPHQQQQQQQQLQQQYHQHPKQAFNANATTTTTTILTTTAITGLAAFKAVAATATATLTVNNLYGGVAVGLGAMLINDTLLLEADNGHWISNGSLLFDDVVENADNNNNNGSDLMLNGSATNLTSSNNATAGEEDFGELLRMATTSVVLGLLILITIIGNVFVIAAIILERNLQNVANYLVASLAVADLLVACLVMPLSAVYEISQGWILGPELCDIWTSCDVLCCTASILHLVAIAVDRYWAVTNIDYIHSRTSKRVFLMIFCVWSAAVIVSLAPQFGWKDPDYLQRIEQQKCMVSQDVSYQVFATCCTFYVPLLVILALYWKIYQTARKRIHRRRPRPIDVTGNNNQPDLSIQKTRTRLRLRIGKFATPHHTSATTTAGQTALGLVEGNSTNTVNTVEDTEFSSSNVDSKSRAGNESTTMFSQNPEEIPTTSTSQISTVSHLVALANQQHTATKSSSTSAVQHQQQQQQQQQQQTQQHKGISSNNSNINTVQNGTTTEVALTTITTETTIENNKLSTTTTPATTATTKVCIVAPNDSSSNGINVTTTPTALNGSTITTQTGMVMANGAAEVLEDPLLQQQLQQVQQQVDMTTTTTTTTTPTATAEVVAGGGKTVPPAACASNATTITSISALSPQTPTTAVIISAGGASGDSEHLHPLAPTAMQAMTAASSCQLTPTPKLKHAQQQQQLSSIANPVHKVTKRKETLEAKRERKAAKTLAIITGAFVICWLPFFVMALLLPLCETCEINDGLASVFLWLGYFNSTLNPVIYTIFSPEFRQAFKRILFGGHRPVHYRSGKI